MSALYGSTDFSVPQTPASLRIGAGALVLALHVAFIGAIALSRQDENAELKDEPAVMVSVIEAPAPQQAKADPQPQPPTPVEQPPVPPVEQPAEQPPDPQPDPKPEPVEEPPPPPVQHVEPLAPVIKPRPKPPAKPPAKPQPPKPQAAPAPAPQAPAPAPAAPTGTPEGQQQVSQAPRQADPVMVNSVEFDGPRPAPVYPMASRMRREEGTVVVLVRISPQGGVEQATIDTSSGFSRLDDAALDAARRARFKPLMRNGVALTALARLPFDFKMRN